MMEVIVSQSAFARVLVPTVIVIGAGLLLSACGDFAGCRMMPAAVTGALPGNPAGGGVSGADNPATGSNTINGPSSCD